MVLAGQGTFDTLSLDSLAQFFTALFIFAFVLFITWFTSKYVAGYKKQQMTGANVEIIETVKITPNKYLQIIRAGDKYLLIAVCKDTVTMLSELSQDSLTEREAVQNMQIDFGSILDKAKKRLSGRNVEKEQADRDE